MKNIILLAFALFIQQAVISQTKIDASDILEDIKNGKDVVLKNVTIDGVLDLTYMDEALEKLPKKKKRSWWGNNNYSNKIEKLIDVNLSFESCTFNEDVLAYIPDEDSGYTFTASFEKEAIFKNCKFEGKATFKYAKFDNNVSFANSIFEDSAVFKYTNFYDGVSFENTNFEEDLNIKYMKVRGDFNISKMKVAYSIDSKYTKINGKDFNKYLLDRNQKNSNHIYQRLK